MHPYISQVGNEVVAKMSSLGMTLRKVATLTHPDLQAMGVVHAVHRDTIIQEIQKKLTHERSVSLFLVFEYVV